MYLFIYRKLLIGIRTKNLNSKRRSTNFTNFLADKWLRSTNFTNSFFIANPSPECRNNGAIWRNDDFGQLAVSWNLLRLIDPLITRGVMVAPDQLNNNQKG